MRKEPATDPALVAFCGLYCGACGGYLRDRCPGCAGNEKATWCAVRTCCLDHGYSSCAQCAEFADPRDCRKFHTFISRAIGFVLRSDRRACILSIRELGPEEYAQRMAREGRRTLRPGSDKEVPP